MDYEGASTSMGHNDPRFELIYHDDIVHEGWIDFKFILMHKDILVITQGCTWDSEQGFWIDKLIN